MREQGKQALGIILGITFALAPPAPAGAGALATSGELRVRTWQTESYFSDDQQVDFWDQRLRLSLDWDAGEAVRVHARADVLEGMWGDDSSRQAVDFEQLSAQFVWPRTPVRVTVGRQDVSWGTGYWVQEDNRDRLAVGLKLDPVKILVAYDKFVDVSQSPDMHGDSHAWAIGAITNAAGMEFGLLVANLRDRSRTRFPAGDLDYWSGGLYAVGRLGPVDTRAEVVSGSGTIDRTNVADLDVSGLGAYASAAFALGTVRLTLEGAYAAGDKPETTDRNEGFFNADYQGPFWSLIFYNNFDITGFARDRQSSSPEADFSVRNARAGKLSLAWAPARRISVTLSGLVAAVDRPAPGVDDALGQEFDLLVVYGLTDQVTLTAGVGYAVLGDYWKSAPLAGGTGERPDNPLVSLVAIATRF